MVIMVIKINDMTYCQKDKNNGGLDGFIVSMIKLKISDHQYYIIWLT